MKMPFFYQVREHSTLPFPDTNFAIKVITVHDGKRVQKVSNRQIIQGFLWQLSLRQQLLHHFLSFVDRVLTQTDIRGGDEVLGQEEVFLVHLIYYVRG